MGYAVLGKAGSGEPGVKMIQLRHQTCKFSEWFLCGEEEVELCQTLRLIEGEGKA